MRGERGVESLAFALASESDRKLHWSNFVAKVYLVEFIRYCEDMNCKATKANFQLYRRASREGLWPTP